MSEPDAYLDDDAIIVTNNNSPQSYIRPALSSLCRTGEALFVGMGYEEATLAMALGWFVANHNGGSEKTGCVIDSISISGMIINVMPVTDEGARHCRVADMMELESDTRLDVDDGNGEGGNIHTYKTAVPALYVRLRAVKRMIMDEDGGDAGIHLYDMDGDEEAAAMAARARAMEVLLPDDRVTARQDVVYVDGLGDEEWYGAARVEAWQKINESGRVFIQGREDGIGQAILIAASMVDGEPGSSDDDGGFKPPPNKKGGTVVLGDIRGRCLESDGHGAVLEIELLRPALLTGQT